MSTDRGALRNFLCWLFLGLLPLLLSRAAGAEPESRLSITARPGNAQEIGITAAVGKSYELQGSTNLILWDPLVQFALTNSPLLWIDPDASALARRFYRLKDVPASTNLAHFLLGFSGATPVFGEGVSFSDRLVSASFYELSVVNVAQPSPSRVVEPAGAFAADVANFGHQAGVLEAVVDPVTGLYSNLRTRFTVYPKNNRLWKIDHLAPATGPVPELWSSLATTELCSISISTLRRTAHDYADGSHSWMFFISPSPGKTCTSFPDTSLFRALRLDMKGDEAPLTIPRPLLPLHNRSGVIDGFLVQDGLQVQRVDARFANPVNLFKDPSVPVVIGADTIYPNLAQGCLFGTNAPGIWVFPMAHQNNPRHLMAYVLPGGGNPVPLLSAPLDGLAANGSVFHQRAETDGASLFLAMNNGFTSSVVRIDHDLTYRILGGIEAEAQELGLTDSHVILRAGKTLRSIPKTGGAARTIAMLPNTEEWLLKFRQQRVLRVLDGTSQRLRAFLTGGENVWFEVVQPRAPLLPRNHVYVVRADGTEPLPQKLSNKAIVTWAARQELLWSVDGGAHVLYIADQHTLNTASVTRTDFGGKPIQVYEGATRNILFEAGLFPAPLVPGTTRETIVSKSEVLADPFQFGQPGLVPIFGGRGGNDLLLLRGGSPGLTPATHYGVD